MSTPEDLRFDVDREIMLDRCDALHTPPEGVPEDGCPGCEARAQRAREDTLSEMQAVADHFAVDGHVTVARRTIDRWIEALRS